MLYYMLCDYADMFGKPNEGLHKYRFFGVAIVDLLLTIIIAYMLYHWTNYNFIIILIVLLVTGVIIHKLFCVKTAVNNYLFN